MSAYNTAISPALLCDQLRTKKYVVPIYQRLFVWGEVQINTLLDDLMIAMKTANPYYIGVITVVEKNNQWEIVDGQQRLTFLTLFGCECLRRHLMDEWKTFIYFDSGDNMSANAKPLRIHYFGRKEDESDIESMLSDSNDWTITEVKNSNFRLFHDCFEIVMRKLEAAKVDKQTFAKYVFLNASFLISELPDTYSPLDLNLHFEKMNAAGRQLEPVDIVKGKYFAAYAATWNECLNFDVELKNGVADRKETDDGQVQCIMEIINDKTSPVDEPDGLKEVSYSRLVMKPSVFLLHVLQLSTKNEILRDPTRLIKTFAEHMQSLDRTAFIEKMREYRKWLDDNIIFLKRGADCSYEYFFRNELRESAEENVRRENAKRSFEACDGRMMKQFQSMLYVSSSDFQEWVLVMFEKCNMERAKLSLKMLQHWDNQRHPYGASLNWNYWNIDRYWFWKLDYILWEKFQKSNTLGCVLNPQEEVAIDKYVFRGNRSIEHLHPQTSSDKWCDDFLHGFGNLAMISVGFNSQQGNDTVGTKFGRMTDKINVGELESIKLLLMFKKAAEKDIHWTAGVAEKHAEEMHTLLECYYQEII